MDLFARERFETVSVAQIAAAAAVCKANVFHHFESKEALYLAVMQRISEPLAEYAEALLEEDCSSAEKISRLLTFELHHMLKDTQRTRLILRECSDEGHPQAGELAKQAFRRNFLSIVALFEQGQHRGEFRSEFSPACATVAYASIKMFFFQQHSMILSRPELAHLQSVDVFAEQTCGILLGGLLSRAPEGATGTRKGRKAPAPGRQSNA